MPLCLLRCDDDVRDRDYVNDDACGLLKSDAAIYRIAFMIMGIKKASVFTEA